jgi:hypothetical protein
MKSEGESMKKVRNAAVGLVALAVVAAAGAAGAGARGQALPAKQIESILQLQGDESNGVLSISPSLKIVTHINGVRLDPTTALASDLDFQGRKDGSAMFNGDIPVRTAQMNAVIDALIANHLVFQAEHQHFYDLSPMVWFVHFRGAGSPTALATSVKNVLLADRMPLGQKPPENPRTPFDWKRIKSILGASSATTEEDGVVHFVVDRRNQERLGGVPIDKELNIATPIDFQPLNKTGTRAVAVPDFGMTGSEIQGVVSTMRAQGWDIGCLYNQETSESPQLYFSHELKTGDPYQLAAEIRKGLERMNVEH